MTGQVCPQSKIKIRRNLNPCKCTAASEAAPCQVPDKIVERLGWEAARSPNCKLKDPPAAYFYMCIDKGSKQALAAGVSDVLEAWKKWKLSCVIRAKDYLSSADEHGIRTQETAEAVGPCSLCMGL